MIVGRQKILTGKIGLKKSNGGAIFRLLEAEFRSPLLSVAEKLFMIYQTVIKKMGRHQILNSVPENHGRSSSW